jgi:hypothetical protein
METLLWTRDQAAAADRHTIDGDRGAVAGADGAGGAGLRGGDRARAGGAFGAGAVRAGEQRRRRGGDRQDLARARGGGAGVHLLAERCEGALAEQVAIAARVGVTIERGLPAGAAPP